MFSLFKAIPASRAGWWLAAIASVLLACWAYAPGLAGPFLLDDYSNIVENNGVLPADGGWQAWLDAAFSTGFGISGRPLSMLSFAVNAYFSGMVPFAFKVTNLFVHLLNGIGLYHLTRLLLRAYGEVRQYPYSEAHIRWISLGIAAIWLLHPLNVTTVLYVVQRMTSLASLFMILGMLAYAWARLRMFDENPAGARWNTLLVFWLCLPLFGGLALLCKESATLLPLYFFAMEAGVFRFRAADPGNRRHVKAYYLLVLALPVVVGMVHFGLHHVSVLATYDQRQFTVWERLLTEFRVMWFYLRLILLPNGAALGLFHDDFPISHGLWAPPTTLLAVLGVAALLGLAAYRLRTASLLGFGILWYFLGHSLESTFLPLEMVFEHRNYLPMYGILLPIYFGLFQTLRSPETRKIRLFVGAALLLFMAVSTRIQAMVWESELTFLSTEATYRPQSPRANFQLGALYMGMFQRHHIQDYFEEAQMRFVKTSELEPHHPRGLALLVLLNAVAGKPVKPEWFSGLRNILENSRLSPDALNSIGDVARCQKEGGCHLPDEEIVSLYESVLKNPRSAKVQRLEAYAQLGDYNLVKLNKIDAAISLFQKAAALGPDSFGLRWRLANALVLAGRFDEAELEQTRLGNEFGSNQFKAHLEKLRKKLMDARHEHANRH